MYKHFFDYNNFTMLRYIEVKIENFYALILCEMQFYLDTDINLKARGFSKSLYSLKINESIFII